MWKETTEQERNLKIYNEEVRDFVPQRVLDFHVHVFNEGTIPRGVKGFELPGTVIGSYTIPELLDDYTKLLPGKECSAVVFGFPDGRYDSDVNNRYVAEQSDRKRLFPFRLIRPEEDPERIEEELRSMHFLGVKPYLNYVKGKSRDDIEIWDMLPLRIMEVVDRLGLIVMLHIPRSGRLADPVNQGQLVELAERFPKARIVLAHIGRAYYLRNILGKLDRIMRFRNVYCDIAMLNNWEVLEHLFSEFDRNRVLFGTDLPIAACGGISVEINNQYTYVTSKPWHLSISDDHGKLVFTAFVYEQIRAIKKAVKRLKLKQRFLEDLFYNNGAALLKQVG